MSSMSGAGSSASASASSSSTLGTAQKLALIETISVGKEMPLYVAALCPNDQFQSMALSLMDLGNAADNTVALVRHLLEADFVAKGSQKGSIMRNESLGVRTLRLFSKQVAFQYLQQVVAPIVKELCSARMGSMSMEIDQSKLDTRNEYERNLVALKEWSAKLLDALTSPQAMAALPRQIRGLCYSIQSACEQYMGNEGNVRALVSGFVVLRFLGPALTTPKEYGLLELSVDVEARQQRNLVLLSKVLQQTALGKPFGKKEKFLTVMNEFVSANSERMGEWLQDVCKDTDKSNLRPFPDYDTYTRETFAERETELQDSMRNCRTESAKTVVDFLAEKSAGVVEFIREHAEEISGDRNNAPYMLQDFEVFLDSVGRPKGQLVVEEINALRNLLEKERESNRDLKKRLDKLQGEFDDTSKVKKELEEYKADHGVYVRQLQTELDRTTRDLDTIRQDMRQSLIAESEQMIYKCRNFFTASAKMMRMQLERSQQSLHADNERRHELMKLLRDELPLEGEKEAFLRRKRQEVPKSLLGTTMFDQTLQELATAQVVKAASIPVSAHETLMEAQERRRKLAKAPTAGIPKKRSLVLFVENLKSASSREEVKTMTGSHHTGEKLQVNEDETADASSSSSSSSSSSEETQPVQADAVMEEVVVSQSEDKPQTEEEMLAAVEKRRAMREASRKDGSMQEKLKEVEESMVRPKVKSSASTFSVNDILEEASKAFRDNYDAMKHLVDHLVSTCQLLFNENEELREQSNSVYEAQKQELEQMRTQIEQQARALQQRGSSSSSGSRAGGNAREQRLHGRLTMLDEENRKLKNRLSLVLASIDSGMGVSTELFKLPLHNNNSGSGTSDEASGAGKQAGDGAEGEENGRRSSGGSLGSSGGQEMDLEKLAQENLRLRKEVEELQSTKTHLEQRVRKLEGQVAALQESMQTNEAEWRQSMQTQQETQAKLQENLETTKKQVEDVRTMYEGRVKNLSEQLEETERKNNELVQQAQHNEEETRMAQQELMLKKVYSASEVKEDMLRMQEQLRLQTRQMKRLEEANNDLKRSNRELEEGLEAALVQAEAAKNRASVDAAAAAAAASAQQQAEQAKLQEQGETKSKSSSWW